MGTCSYFDDGVCPVECFFHASGLADVVTMAASGDGRKMMRWVVMVVMVVDVVGGR